MSGSPHVPPQLVKFPCRRSAAFDRPTQRQSHKHNGATRLLYSGFGEPRYRLEIFMLGVHANDRWLTGEACCVDGIGPHFWKYVGDPLWKSNSAPFCHWKSRPPSNVTGYSVSVPSQIRARLSNTRATSPVKQMGVLWTHTRQTPIVLPSSVHLSKSSLCE